MEYFIVSIEFDNGMLFASLLVSCSNITNKMADIVRLTVEPLPYFDTLLCSEHP